MVIRHIASRMPHSSGSASRRAQYSERSSSPSARILRAMRFRTVFLKFLNPFQRSPIRGDAQRRNVTRSPSRTRPRYRIARRIVAMVRPHTGLPLVALAISACAASPGPAGSSRTSPAGARDAGADAAAAEGGTAITPVIPAEPPRYAQVAAGMMHTCARTTKGLVYCWGRVGHPLEIDGRDRYSPTLVPELSKVVDLDVSRASTCALTSDGEVFCNFVAWNAHSMPPFMKAPSEKFERVDGIAGAVSIAVWHQGVCAIVGDGGVWCAGSDALGGRGRGNAYAQPGGATDPASQVPGLSRMHRIVSGPHFAYGGFCAIDDDKKAWCWGYGNPAQFPAGSISTTDWGRVSSGIVPSTKARAQPTVLAGFDDVDDLAWWDDDTCVRRTKGDFVCRGSNKVDAKKLVTAGDRAQIAGGARGRCAVATTGQLTCWNADGSAGRRSDQDIGFTGVSTLTDVESVSIGDRHACAVTKSGGVSCWGEAVFGALGTGVLYARNTPTKVTAPEARQIAAAYDATCARAADGSVRCWGGSLALRKETTPASTCDPSAEPGEEIRCPSPTVVLGAAGAAEIAGSSPLCFRREPTGAWLCDRAGGAAQPVTGMKPDRRFTSLATHGYAFHGLTTDGAAYHAKFFAIGGAREPVLPAFARLAWASKMSLQQLASDGKCGIDSKGDVVCACAIDPIGAPSTRCSGAEVAYVIPELHGALAIVHTPNRDVCAIDAEHRLRCWREHPIPPAAIENGVAPAANVTVPQMQNDVVKIASSAMFESGGTSVGSFSARFGGTACAITRAGELHCWGTATHGELAIESRLAAPTPHRIAGLPPFTDVALGRAHICALTKTGEVYCWGNDAQGQLGLGSPRNLATPTPVARP